MKVLVTDRLGEEGLAFLRDRPGLELDVAIGLGTDELGARLAGAEAWLVRSGTKVTRELLARADRLRVIGRAGIGVDNIDVEAATERGVVVLNTPDANATTTAELTVAHLLSLSRRLPQADRSLREGRWERSSLVGTEVAGKSLGVIGFGTIGRLVAERARGLRMRVLAHDPFVTEQVVRGTGAEPAGLDELLSAADYVSLHCPLLPATRGLIGRERLAAMKPGARLLNCARGGLVDEQALLEALSSGHLAGAALDVFETEPPGENPLLRRDDVVATPHLGASTREAQAAVSLAIARQVAAFLEEGAVQGAVNLPAMGAEEAGRLGPWAELARRLGGILSQLAPWPFQQVQVRLHGRAAEFDPRPITAEALAGILSARLEGAVNRVNAAVLARRQGMTVVESSTEDARDWVSLLTLQARGDGRTLEVAGTLLGERRPRLVRIDQFDVEVVPEGDLMITRHDDRPGVIGAIGSILGEVDVNISGMAVGTAARAGAAPVEGESAGSAAGDIAGSAAGPAESGREATAVIALDGPPPPEALKRLREIPAIRQLSHVRA